jgi:translation initiation factor IF-3
VPVPRRFDRRPPERDQTRVNERIRVPEVRLIGEDGSQIGVLKTDEALRYAQERDLDLVEVAPEARPPVCRALDYSKYKYEQVQKQKQARKHQQQINVREIKFRPKIAQHDYDTKKGHVERFLRHKDKVKITIMFRGREVTHPERGRAILERLAEELSELATVEQHPAQDGRNMTMMLGPSKAVLSGRLDDDATEDADGAVEAAETAAEQPATAPEAPPSANGPVAAPAAAEAAPAPEAAEPPTEPTAEPAAEPGPPEPPPAEPAEPAEPEPPEPPPAAEAEAQSQPAPARAKA